jgi:dipeptidyl aminopeptidase/acylaminoacyl peptidase
VHRDPRRWRRERKLADLGPVADSAQPLPAVSWNADGKSLVVVQRGEKQLPALAVVALDSGKVRRITNPPEGSEGDSTPPSRPPAQHRVRAPHAERGRRYLSLRPTGGGLRRLTFDDRGIRGIAWTRDGQDLVYSGNRVGGWRLWRVPAYGGSPRDLAIAGNRPTIPPSDAIAWRTPTVPRSSAIWRATLGTGDAVEERPVLRSTGREVNPVWSPDGTKIADVSDQSGSDEIFVSDAEGRNRVQITQLKGPRVGRLRWSPDGKTLLFDASSDHGQEVFTVPAAPGSKPARVLLNASNASFSHDGKWIYFQSRGQIWKATPSRRQSASHRRRRWRRPARRIGRRQVHLLPFAPRHLAHSHRRRRRRGGLRPRARYVGAHHHAAHQEGRLLHRIRAQRALHGGLLLRFLHQEELHRIPPAQYRLARRRQLFGLPRRQVHPLRARRSEPDQLNAGGELPVAPKKALFSHR